MVVVVGREGRPKLSTGVVEIGPRRDEEAVCRAGELTAPQIGVRDKGPLAGAVALPESERWIVVEEKELPIGGHRRRPNADRGQFHGSVRTAVAPPQGRVGAVGLSGEDDKAAEIG